MPNIKSAKKRVKVTLIKTERNKAYKSALKTLIKNAINAEEHKKEIKLSAALKKLDKAVSKGILHKNTAARKKAALVRKCKVK